MTNEGLSSGQSAVLHLLRYSFANIVFIVHLLYFHENRFTWLDSLGNYVVVLFFVLSGFVIYHRIYPLQPAGKSGWNSYMRQRILRIYPPLLGALLLTWILDIFAKSHIGLPYATTEYAQNFVLNALQLQEFPLTEYLEKHYGLLALHSPFFGTNLPLWTLAPEWWLYVIAGLIFLAYPTHKRTIWFWALLAFAAVSPIYFLVHSTRVGLGLTIPWIIGLFAAWAGLRMTNNRQIHPLWAILILTIAFLSFRWAGYFVACIFFGLSLFVLAQSRFQLGTKPIRISHLLSGYTYSLFLIHYPLLYFIWALFRPEHTATNMLLSFLAIHIVAYFFSRIFERLSIRLNQQHEN